MIIIFDKRSYCANMLGDHLSDFFIALTCVNYKLYLLCDFEFD